MHSKIKITPVAPRCLGMSDHARAVVEGAQRAFRQRQEQMTPAAQPSGDDWAVREAIDSVRAERQKREETEARIRLAKRSLLAQVAGVPIDQVHTLKHE